MKKLSALTCMKKNNDIYLMDIDTPMVIKYDIFSMDYQIIKDDPFKGLGYYVQPFIVSMIENQDRIFMIDRYLSEIFVFDKDFSLTDSVGEHFHNQETRNREAYLFNDNIYIVPRDMRSDILAVNTRSLELKRIHLGFDENKTNGNCIVVGQNRIDDKIWFAIWKSNCVVCFDMRSEETEYFYLDENVSIDNLACSEKNFWVSCAGNRLFNWGNEEKKYDFLVAGLKDVNSVKIHDVIETKDRLLCIPRKENKVVVIDKKSGEQNVILLPLDEYKAKPVLFGNKIRIGKEWLYIPYGADSFCIVDENCDFQVKKASFSVANYYIHCKKGFLYEEPDLELKEFISGI